MKEKKPDYRLALGYGSAWHLLRCLGWHREKFSKIIAAKLGATEIHWLDFIVSPTGQNYPTGMPVRDSEWKRIAFIEDKNTLESYKQFWPVQGEPINWDCVGRAIIDGREEWLLVEAKAHPGEINSTGTVAKENGGRPKIRAAFKDTIESLGYEEEDVSQIAEQWLAGYYQYANRLATLYFLTKNNISANLIFLYFCSDKHPDGKFCPKNEKEWKPALSKIDNCLFLKGKSKLEERVFKIFIPVDFDMSLNS